MILILIIIMIIIIMIIIIIIIIMIMITMTLKGAIFFYNLLTVVQTVTNTYAQVARVKSCANTSGACYVQRVCHVIRRDSLEIKI